MDKENDRLLFALAPANARGVSTLLIGIPDEAAANMNKGIGKDIDLSPAGVPFQIIVFREKDHDACMKVLEGRMAAADVPFLDVRREDFAIPQCSCSAQHRARNEHRPDCPASAANDRG